MDAAGWRVATALKRLDLTLFLLTVCAPSLTMDMIDDRAVTSRAGKDCNCCKWQPELLPTRFHEHRVKGSGTHYLNVPIGKTGKRTILEKAHRLMCFSLHGPPPPDKPHARHICSNKGGRCINPYHVVWSNQQENNDDVAELKRERSAKRRRAR
jgi:hypothetical protein